MQQKLSPDEIVRFSDGPKFFGFKLTQLAEQIKAGAIPEPKYLAPPPSRARGWLGAQILDWQSQIEAAHAEREAAAKKYEASKRKPVRKGKVARRAKAR
jgi:hypothetical protein